MLTHREHQPETSLSNHDHGVIDLIRSILKTGPNILSFEIRIVLKDLCFGCSPCQHVKHVFDADAHPTNARTAAALTRIEGYSIKQIATHLRHSRYSKIASQSPKSPQRHLHRALQPSSEISEAIRMIDLDHRVL